ncbi:nuclease-related domain-containing protein [Bacillus sp. V59.32b]|uniref:nuclease-related domain-containing protein n=1 Tax=Bacillus sp. V59.32b TaxID=1758642 RepID=UPI0020B12F54|nr:nuclease-related domain-containing protein [Bacillus sp. V59.32b]
MIIKERQIPLRILKLKALLRRLPSYHPKRPDIEKDLARRNAGYNGEESLDYHLRYLPNDKYHIFHDLRLHNDDQYFQIDTLLLTSSYALIVEVKNISGTLLFDQTFNQLIRTIQNKEDGFPNPISQAKRHQQQLQIYMSNLNIISFPIEYLVVISNSATIVKTGPKKSALSQRICHSSDLTDRTKAYEYQYKKEKLLSKDIIKLSQSLLNNHSPHDVDILNVYNISKNEVLTGVQCPICKHLPLGRNHGCWNCPKCTGSSKKSHVQALMDYFLLIKPSISNKEFCNFLKISSRQTAHASSTP